MRITNYFLPILKENPQGAEITSHKLMIRSGMIRQQNSGIYSWLPLGLKVLKKIENLVREEMNKAGALEILMPCIQPAELWKESGRYDVYGKEMLRIEDRHENALLFGPTNEEVVTDIFRNNVKSYKELPKTLYQIQWKFRDEIRPRFGVMRGREFYMKDAYSFDIDEKKAEESYDNMFRAYLNLFKRIGLLAIPVRADTGPIGGNLSHEFHIIANTGESNIFYDKAIEDEVMKDSIDVNFLKTTYAMADDMHEEAKCKIPKERLKHHKSIEVGHIFCFGTKYTKAMNADVMDREGKPQHPYCGSYGIGVSRLVGAIIESSHDNAGIIWPKAIAPFAASLINVLANDAECTNACDAIYKRLSDLGIEILYDDSKASAGQKFSTHDLIGIPHQIIVGSKFLKFNKVELKDRQTNAIIELDIEEVITHLS